MTNNRAISRFIVLLCLTLLWVTAATATEGEQPEDISQQQAIVDLVESLGWSYGLPDRPKMADYHAILNGRRSYHFEFEEILVPGPDAPIIPKYTRSYGPFSGDVWNRGPTYRAQPRISFLLPLSGDYRVTGVVAKKGYQLSIGNQKLSADGQETLQLTDFGTLRLEAGQQSGQLSIPPRGGVDYLLFEAPPLRAVEPIDGWHEEKTLTNGDLAVIVSRALDLEPALPPQEETIEIEAESAPIPAGATESIEAFKGAFSGAWVKPGMTVASYQHLFELPDSGIYDLDLNIFAKGRILGALNNSDQFESRPKTHFTTIRVGTYHLDKGVNHLAITLPSRSGFDRFSLRPRASKTADYLKLTGLEPGTTNREQLDKVLQLLAAIGIPR